MTKKDPAKVDVKLMSKTERRELRRIVARRFKMLRHQLNRRERELERLFAKQVREERAANVAKIEKKLRPLVKRNNALAEQFSLLQAEASDLGVHIQYHGPAMLNPETHAARYGSPPVRAITQDEVRGRLEALKEEAGWGKLNLSELEWRLDEQLAVGELESGSAKEFLETLPSVESLLPLPAGMTLAELEPGEYDPV
jgi:hypothetical protein